MQVLYEESLEQPPPADRLRVMIDALKGDAEISAAMRTEIIDALKRHEIRRANKNLKGKGGGSIEHLSWYAAAIAKELIDSGCIKFQNRAIFAAARSVEWQIGGDPLNLKINDKKCKAIEKSFKKIKDSLKNGADGFITFSGGKHVVMKITQEWMDDAATRLGRYRVAGATPKEINLIVDRQGYELEFITTTGSIAGACGVIAVLLNRTEEKSR